MVDRQDIIDALPTAESILTVAVGDTVSADVENANNQALLALLTLIFQFARDDSPSLSEANTWTGNQTFTGTNSFTAIKTDAINTKTAGANLPIVLTSTGVATIADGTFTASRILTANNYNTLITPISGVGDMSGSSAGSAGIHGLVPAGGPGTQNHALTAGANFTPLIRTASDILISGTPAADQVPIATGAATGSWGYITQGLVCEGRLTLVSGVPVVSTSQTAKTTIYFTPYEGDRIALHDGTTWRMRTFSETAIPVPATTATPFDIFAYDNAGTVAFETVNWASTTTRVTALTTLNGVHVKSGATTRRHIGTGCTTSVSGQTQILISNNHTVGSCLLWNRYHQKAVPVGCVDGTGNYSYASATVRAANGNTTAGVGRFEFVCGDIESVIATSVAEARNETSGPLTFVGTTIGLDSTTTEHTSVARAGSALTAGVGGGTLSFSVHNAVISTYVSAGYHYVQRLESGSTSATTFMNTAPLGMKGIIYA